MKSDSPLSSLDAVGVVTTNSPDYLSRVLELFSDGMTVVPLRSPDDFERTNRLNLRKLETPAHGGGWVNSVFRMRHDATPALVSFTSGTQGVPKAVLLSHGNLSDTVVRLADAMQITPEIREYIGVPVGHSFGFARGRAVLAAGGAAYIPERFDLQEIRNMLVAGDVNALSAVPSQWRIIIRHSDMLDDALKKVCWAEIGSQPMSGFEKDTLRSMMPNARIVQHYGMTEASRTTLLRLHDAPFDRLDSVGRAEGSVEIRISSDGLIETKGPHVALGYDDGVSWQELGSEAWLKTGDAGTIDDGWLTYEGRRDDLINSGGIKLSPDTIEAGVRVKLGSATDFSIVRRPDTLRGEGVGLVLGPAAPDKRTVLNAVDAVLKDMGLDGAGIVDTRSVPKIPLTETGKVQRKVLAGLFESSTTAGETSNDAGAWAEFVEILGKDRIRPEASFNDLGHDSLRHMEMVLALERAFGRAPTNWESQQLGSLASQADASNVAGTKPQYDELPPLPDGSINRNPEGISFWSLVREDFRTNDASIGHQGFWMLFIHRFGNWRMSVHPRVLRAPLSVLYKFLNKMAQIGFGMKLDYTVKVGRRVKLEHFGGMILGAREIGDDTILRQNTTLGVRNTSETRAKPTIGRFVDVGAGAVIVGDVTIGDNSIIGANSVVYVNVPPDTVAVGVPAKIIGKNPRRNPSPLEMRKH